MFNLEAARKRQRLEIAKYRVKEKQCIFDYNDDLVIRILTRLPVKTLVKFKAVCRFWRYLIKYNKHFISLHLTISKNRLRDESTFLMYPTCSVHGTIQIKRFIFCHRDLRFEEDQGHDGSLDVGAVVTRNNRNLKEEEPILVHQPVNGLVCFVRDGGVKKHSAFLICNPNTGVKTPWIETITSTIFKKVRGTESVKNRFNLRVKVLYKSMYGFGMDRTTNQVKVICMYEIGRKRANANVPNELVCGIFTVGENEWRQVEQVPPGIAIFKNINSCIHVCGSVYWMSAKKERNQNSVIMEFDFGNEMFRLIAIPSVILDCWNSIDKIKLVNELVEVDGHLAILVREGDDLLNLWKYNVDGSGSSVTAVGIWIKETIQLPCRWDEIDNLDFKTIIGTNLVVIKFSRKPGYGKRILSEFIQYYDRREKKCYKNLFEILWDYTSFCRVDGTYSITPFFETLLPVMPI